MASRKRKRNTSQEAIVSVQLQENEESRKGTEVQNQIAGDLIQELVVTCDYYSAHYYQQMSIQKENSIRLTAMQKETDALRKCYNELEREKERWNAGKVAEERETLAALIQELVSTADDLSDLLSQQRKENGKLKIQISYLNAQNQRYQRAFGRITETWWGKIAHKIYHFLCRIRLL